MPYRLEKASSARSKCRGAYPCGNDLKIEKGEARLGVLVEIQGHQSFHWRHLWCLTPTIWSNIKAEMGDDSTDVDGYEELDEEDQALFSKAYAQGSIDKDDAPERLQKAWKKNAKARDKKKKEDAKKKKRDKKMRECADKGIPYESSEEEKEEEDSDEEEEEEEKKPVVDAKTTPKGKGKAKADAKASPATPKSPRSPKASTSAAANKKNKKKPAAKSAKKEESEDDDEGEVGDLTEEEDEDEMSDLGDTSEEDVKPAAKAKGKDKGKGKARTSMSSSSRGRGTKRKQDSEDEDEDDDDDDDGGTSEEEVMPKGKDRSGGRPKQAAGPSAGSTSHSLPAKSQRSGRGGRGGQARGRGRGGARGGRKSANKQESPVDSDGEESKPVVKTETNVADDAMPPAQAEDDVKPKINKRTKKVKKEV